MRSTRYEGGQATVELALLLPVVVLLMLSIVQAGLIIRDHLGLVNAARIGARAAALEPTTSAASSAVAEHSGIGLAITRIRLSGDLRPGGVATIQVSVRPTLLPIIGGLIRSTEITEKLAFRVEDPEGPGP